MPLAVTGGSQTYVQQLPSRKKESSPPFADDYSWCAQVCCKTRARVPPRTASPGHPCRRSAGGGHGAALLPHCGGRQREPRRFPSRRLGRWVRLPLLPYPRRVERGRARRWARRDAGRCRDPLPSRVLQTKGYLLQLAHRTINLTCSAITAFAAYAYCLSHYLCLKQERQEGVMCSLNPCVSAVALKAVSGCIACPSYGRKHQKACAAVSPPAPLQCHRPSPPQPLCLLPASGQLPARGDRHHVP